MMPSLRQLEYFVAVARTLNFRQAAEECLVSQPALSAQIQQLETTLGVQLFERNKRRVLLTPAGRELSDRARRVLHDVGDLVASAAAFHAPLEGPLRLGVIPTVAPYLLPRALPSLRARYPALQLFLREDQTASLVQRLDEGEIDVVLLALEAELGDTETVRLFDDPFLLALPAGHALAARAHVTEADLHGEVILLLEEGHCLRAQALSFCERAATPEHDVAGFAATSLPTLLEMVAAGLGVTLIPEMAVASATASGGELVFRPFAGTPPQRSIALGWRAHSPRRGEYELLAEVLATA